MRDIENEKAIALLAVIVLILLIMVFMAAVLIYINNQSRIVEKTKVSASSFYGADSGVDWAKLNVGDKSLDYDNEGNVITAGDADEVEVDFSEVPTISQNDSDIKITVRSTDENSNFTNLIYDPEDSENFDYDDSCAGDSAPAPADPYNCADCGGACSNYTDGIEYEWVEVQNPSEYTCSDFVTQVFVVQSGQPGFKGLARKAGLYESIQGIKSITLRKDFKVQIDMKQIRCEYTSDHDTNPGGNCDVNPNPRWCIESIELTYPDDPDIGSVHDEPFIKIIDWEKE